MHNVGALAYESQHQPTHILSVELTVSVHVYNDVRACSETSAVCCEGCRAMTPIHWLDMQCDVLDSPQSVRSLVSRLVIFDMKADPIGD